MMATRQMRSRMKRFLFVAEPVLLTLGAGLATAILLRLREGLL